MYEAHFGLNSRPFGAKAEGPKIFAGPQQVKAVQGVQKGLLAQDAVVTITGPIGAGKTTIVSRALETIKPNRMAAWIGRMHLAQDELLDLLLVGFGVRQQVNGSVRRFALFRRIMAERAAAGAAVAIVVEDAMRLGVDTLAELEALTAADTGDSIGASIILMGPPELCGFLKSPSLARLKQRIRRREKVTAFSQPEVTGYLKHCMRQAGADYDALFDAGVDQIVFRCSEGVPRVINSLCENVLAAAADAGLSRITTGLMHEVASDNYTYEGPPPDFISAPDIAWEAPPADESANITKAENDPLATDEDELPPSARNIVVESGRYPELPEDPVDAAKGDAGPAPAPSVEPTAVGSALPDRDPPAPASPEPDPKSVGATAKDATDQAPGAQSFEVPELINDTQPELSALPLPTSDEAIEPLTGPSEENAREPERDAGASAGRTHRVANAPAAKPSPAANAGDEAPSVEDGDSPATADDASADEAFDLDAALSIDTDDTNVMKSITPNLDALGRDNPQPPAEDAPGPAPGADDLPTLSDSMRVDVDRQVRKAKKAEAVAVGKIRTAPSADAIAAGPETATAGAVDARHRPLPAAKVDTPKTPATKPPVVRPPAKAPTAIAAGDAAPQKTGAAKQPKSNDVGQPGSAGNTPERPVSEMTARIAAIDLAKRGSDVDSLEAALAAAKKRNLDDLVAPAPTRPAGKQAQADAAPETRPALPEITLDAALAEKQKKKREEMEKHAQEISRVKSLEEFSDAMAETLFGNEEFEAIAAEVVANPPEDHEMADPPPAGPSPVFLDEPETPGESPPALALEEEPQALATNVPVDKPLLDTQALKVGMPDALGANGSADDFSDAVGETVELGQEQAEADTRPSGGPQPESIENQIDTVMTQTLAALDVSAMADRSAGDQAEEKPKKKSGGLFSRFRKSS
jgi:type II secretory pathway predicted ATPase ExeA